MPLTKLQLTNFRSYPEAVFELSPAITLVVGPNASGKTNLLEAIYVLASTKSFRAKDQELIHHGQDYFRLVGQADSNELALSFGGTGAVSKRVSHNGAKKTLVTHVGSLQTVLFEPSDMELISGTPERRRRYLDYILCQTDRAYLKMLNQYRRVLKQRNSLLSAFDTGRIQQEIFAWDVQLTELASVIYSRRLELIAHINELAHDLYAEIAGSRQELDLIYVSSVDGDDYAEVFLHELATRLTRDLAAGFTTIGPHREDFKVRFKNNNITAVASRGEVRTAVLVLKMAELAYSEAVSGQKPLLLLDDVFSELDASRRRYLTQAIRGYQSVITTTEADAIDDLDIEHVTIRTEAK
jgi:DNA replication and repair protein RecF